MKTDDFEKSTPGGRMTTWAVIGLLLFFGFGQAGYGVPGYVPETPEAPQQVAGAFEFRNMGSSPLDKTEAMLRSAPVGRLVAAGAFPVSQLVNYIYRDRKFYFPIEPKQCPELIAALKKDKRVTFVVDKCGADYWHSVHVFGEATIIEGEQATADWLKNYEQAQGSEGFSYSAAQKADTVFVELKPSLVTAKWMGWGFHYYGKLKLTRDGKLQPKMPMPKENEETQFAADVKSVGLPLSVADNILRQSHAGRINTLGKDYPYSVPLNYGFYDGKIHFHTGKDSLKITNIKGNANVSFDVDWFWDGKDWYAVTVVGKARLLPSEQFAAVMETLGQFMRSPDGRIPKDFKPDPDRKINVSNISVVELVPQKVITRKIAIPKEWLSKMTEELKR